MKKITFLFALLIGAFGYSQELPFTFTDGGVPTLHGIIGDVPEVIIANALDPDDVTNDVLSITGSGNDWDNAQVLFANNLDLSDDSNNTITFRFKNIADDGVHTHALKFENGTGPNTELVFTTEDDQWKDISLDFPAGLGSYGKMVIFTDFGSANTAVGTYLIDDIAGASHTSILPEFSLPVDFSDDFNDMMLGGDATVSIVTDPDDATNNVLQVIGSGGDWDHAQATFVAPLDLSDDANNTMRFRVRSTTAAPGEVNDHLFKLEQATAGGDVQLEFSTTGTDWHDIELNFGSGLSSYGKLVIFVDSGLGNSAAVIGTYLFDDILAPGADAEEEEPEPVVNTDCAGQTDEAQQGEFTDGYNYAFVTTGTSVEFTFQLLDDKAGVVAYLWRQSPFNEVPMTSLGDRAFSTTINDLTVGDEVSYACKFAYAGGQSVTKYFTYEVGDDCTLSTVDFETTAFKVFPNPTKNNWNIESNTTINSITVFDILGKKVSVVKPNATEAVINTSSLKSGVYFARVEGVNGSKSVKLIKE
ncbi:putative secreted protein (Por secretion system target) [Winogradskyella pacifica]|uniref:Putative secreted protein (Por secretion system target) n=1 Tax=Winogradskyella pacifica TaxID=664642 RepID=A0A3D9LKS1_9FLAO|nr:T9SS type A sorting domain-containing protein [Winogradskyella pacifica]REE07989.1 putative secreted protein (Por secretion system target) [Winogradskyella pacifica]